MDNIVYSPKQIAAASEWQDPLISEILYDGGARCGKTWLICHAFISRAINNPNSRWLIGRYRYNHMITTVWMQTLLPLLKLHFPEKKLYEIDNKYTIINFFNGSSIWGTGLDEDERVEKIMGSEFNGIFLNEVSQMSFATYQKLKTRLSLKAFNEQGKQVKNLIIADCNPRNRYHWAYQYFVLNKDPITKQALPEKVVSRKFRRHWTPYDNPFLSKEYIENLEGLTGVEAERLLKGEWVNQEGLVYPDYESIVCEPFQLPGHWLTYGAIDFGYTNPFVYLWIAYDKANETYYFVNEHYEKQKTVKEHSKIIKQVTQDNNYNEPQFVVADHDAEDRATLEENGINTIAAEKDIESGIQVVKDLMGNKNGIRIRVFRTCVNLIEEFSGYSWSEIQENKNQKEIPKKVNDHAMDAFRYFCKAIVKTQISDDFGLSHEVY